MKYLFLCLAIGLVLSINTLDAQDEFEAYLTEESYIIDGQADEDFWTDAIWYNIDQVWLPYGTSVASSDFEGRLKLAWTPEKLLLFVEVKDDILIDQYEDPVSRYWDDDCVEIFLDEDKSGGNHENGADAFNAFAYHVSVFGDVADYGPSSAELFNDHLEMDLDTGSNNTYTWEFAISIYDDSYTLDGANTPVTLVKDKEMGFSLAYCDNDASNSRENFVGAVYVTSANQNASYQNASVFGVLTLKEKKDDPDPDPEPDPDPDPSTGVLDSGVENIKVFPNPASSILNIDYGDGGIATVNLRDLSGKIVFTYTINNKNSSIDISAVAPGIYLLDVKGVDSVFIQQVIIQ